MSPELMKDMNLYKHKHNELHIESICSQLCFLIGQGRSLSLGLSSDRHMVHHHATRPGEPGQMEKHTRRPSVTAES